MKLQFVNLIFVFLMDLNPRASTNRIEFRYTSISSYNIRHDDVKDTRSAHGSHHLVTRGPTSTSKLIRDYL